MFSSSVVRLPDCLHMTIAVDWDVKPQAKQNNYCYSEFFARILILIKPSPNSEIILLLTDVGKSCPSREFECGKYV